MYTMQALSAPRVFTGEEFLTNYAVIIDAGKIVQLCQVDQVDHSIPNIILNDGFICAGFIDLQVNGGGGVLFNEQTEPEAIFSIADAHRQFGTTSILPTLISDTPNVLENGIRATNRAHQQRSGQVLGLHIEGPFFNVARRGIHDERFIRPVGEKDLEIFSRASSGVHLMTLAPEQVETDFIQQLKQLGYHIWAGHSNAGYKQIDAAIDAGLSGFTHLYNAMSPLNSREPGMVGTAMTADNCWASIIADGYHVHKKSIEIALRCKPKGKLILISDAMSTVGTTNKQFVLNGQLINDDNGVLVDNNGTLAGSAISLMDAVNYLTACVGVDQAEALRMATLYPAEAIAVDHYLGRIKSGYMANLIHIVDQAVLRSWINGKMMEHHTGEVICA